MFSVKSRIIMCNVLIVFLIFVAVFGLVVDFVMSVTNGTSFIKNIFNGYIFYQVALILSFATIREYLRAEL